MRNCGTGHGTCYEEIHCFFQISRGLYHFRDGGAFAVVKPHFFRLDNALYKLLLQHLPLLFVDSIGSHWPMNDETHCHNWIGFNARLEPRPSAKKRKKRKKGIPSSTCEHFLRHGGTPRVEPVGSTLIGS